MVSYKRASIILLLLTIPTFLAHGMQVSEQELQCGVTSLEKKSVKDNNDPFTTLILVEQAIANHAKALAESGYCKPTNCSEKNPDKPQEGNDQEKLPNKSVCSEEKLSYMKQLKKVIKACWYKIPWPVQGSLQGLPWLCAGFWLATKMQLCWCRYYCNNNMLNKCWLC